MKTRTFLVLFVALVVFGCGPESKHNFFKPEIPDATYAASKARPQEVRAELEKKINCPGTEYGHSPCIDMDGQYEGWGFVDEDVVLAAPRFTPVPAVPSGDPDPTEADTDGGLNKAKLGDPTDVDAAGDPTADD